MLFMLSNPVIFADLCRAFFFYVDNLRLRWIARVKNEDMIEEEKKFLNKV